MGPGSAAHHAAKSGALRSIRGTDSRWARCGLPTLDPCVPIRRAMSPVSRTRCSVLHDAPQSRDPRRCGVHSGPRISSAPRREERRAAQHPGNGEPLHAYRPRDDGFQSWLRILAAGGARVVREAFALEKTEGVGNAGCRCTRSLVCDKNKHTSVVTTGPPESPGIPARNGFNGLFRALPGDEFVLSPSSAD